MSYERKTCRLCDGSVHKVIVFEPTPIANAFPAKPDSLAKRYPLDLVQCDECNHVQIGYVIDDKTLYKNYKYSTPPAFMPHLEQVADLICKETEGPILEIGANNGMLTRLLRKRGRFTTGLDPTPGEGVTEGYFSPEWAQKAMLFDVIVALNCFAHIDDLKSVFEGINECLSPKGTLIFEVSYVCDMVEKGVFDMVYHEHRDYHAIKPLRKFLGKYGFVITQCERINTHGGSIRITAKRNGKEMEWLDLYNEHINWAEYKNHIHADKRRFRTQIGTQQIQAFGAAAKAVTLIHHFRIADRIVRCIDDTPQKQGRYIAGTNIPVVPRSEIGPEPVLITAWNYANEIASQFPDREMITPYARDVAA